LNSKNKEVIVVEVFVIKFIKTMFANTDDEGCQECIELFYNEIEFKNKLTELENTWEVKDIKVYSGSIPRTQ
jgi:hypothetical protein